jgi:hypothetical protein
MRKTEQRAQRTQLTVLAAIVIFGLSAFFAGGVRAQLGVQITDHVSTSREPSIAVCPFGTETIPAGNLVVSAWLYWVGDENSTYITVSVGGYSTALGYVVF